MEYSRFCEIYSALEKTTKGLEKTQILAEFLDEIKNRPEWIYLLKGKVFADYDPREFGISIQLAIKAISKAGGVSDKEVLELFKELGDLGKAIEKIFGNKKQTSLFPQKLKVEKVFANLHKIPAFIGKGTVQQKVDLVVELLNSASAIEAKYLIRTVLGDLKVGTGNGILRDAIAINCFKPKSLEEKKIFVGQIQEAYDKSTDFAEVFDKACKNKLDKIILTPGKPVKVMLYPKAKDVEDAFRIVGKPAAFEFKYDGFRVMINKSDDGKIRIFTRRLDEVTTQFPDIVEFVEQNIHGKSFIVDAEAVGYDSETKTYREFQAMSQRIKRKYDIERLVQELPIELRVFDVIYFEGKNLTEKPYEMRRKLLKKIVSEKKWKIMLAEQIVTDSEEEAEKFFQKALDEGQEGLMVKGLDKKYKPGARIGYGVKWKPEDKDFDLVITGAEWGTGKRAGWLTSFDVSCIDENGNFQEIGKVSTGLKELREQGLSFDEMTEILKRIIIEEHGKKIEVRPEVVVTVQYQNIQKSPTYSSGYALRFPRIVRIRPDRSAEEVATMEEVEGEVVQAER